MKLNHLWPFKVVFESGMTVYTRSLSQALRLGAHLAETLHATRGKILSFRIETNKG
jgi:hypothetical protein